MSNQTHSLKVVGISGSPSPNSRSRLLVARTLAHLGEQGVKGQVLELTELPAEALLARSKATVVDEAIREALTADILVLGTPVYRASYAGQLKAFFDLFPQDSLQGRVVGLIATGAGAAHSLVIDQELRPLVASLRGLSAAQSLYVTDSQIPDKSQLSPELDAQTAKLAQELAVLAHSFSVAKGE